MVVPYCVRRLPAGSLLADWSSAAAWDNSVWNEAEIAGIERFHPRSSEHHPHTAVRLLYDRRDIFIRFDVQDQYVRSTATEYQSMVCFDSCVEFFFRPRPDRGYFNLEINCGGTFLMSYIEDPRRTDRGFAKSMPVSWEDARQIQIYHSLPATVFPERENPTPWRLGVRLPLETIEPYLGAASPLDGRTWTGNFYKCADRTSHPHWASWTPQGEALNFHDPDRFGPLRFED